MKRILLYLCPLILGIAADASAAEVLFSDTFSGVSGRPAGWAFDTRDERFWTVESGWLYSGKGNELVAAQGFSLALIDSPVAAKWGDCRISCRFWMKQSSGSVILVGRYRNRENFFRASLDLYADSVAMRLARVSAGKAVEVAGETVDLGALGLPDIRNGSPDKAVEFSLSFSGASVTASLNGQVVVRGRDPDPQNGQLGVGQRMNEVHFGDVLVTPAEGSGPPPAEIKTIYHLMLAEGFSPAQAQELGKTLEDSGNGPAILRGTKSSLIVLQGNYLTPDEAAQARTRLEDAKYKVLNIVAEKRGAAAGAAPAGAPRFRVQVGAWKAVSDARGQVAALRQQDYFPSTESDEEYTRVFVGGLFATKEEATRLQARMVAEGFLLAKVVSSEPLGGEGVAVAVAPRRDFPTMKVLEGTEWAIMSQTQRDKVIEIMAKERASREGYGSLEEVLELKNMVNQLSREQKKIVEKLADSEAAEEKRQKDIRQLVSRINRKQDEGDIPGALELVDQLEKADPGSPIALFKRQTLENAQKGTFEGEEVLFKRQREKLTQMETRADEQANKAGLDDLREARRLYQSLLSENAVLGEQASDKELAGRVNNKITGLDQRITDGTNAEKKQSEGSRKREQMLVWGAIGGVGVLLLAVLLLVYIAGRRHYSRMLQQLQEEAIAPLQELQQKTRRLTAGGAAAGGLTFESSGQSLIEQTEPSGAEFMIPDTQPAPSSDAFDGGGGLQASGTSLADMNVEEFSFPGGSPGTPSPAQTGRGEEDFMMDFTGGGGPQAPERGSSSLPSAQPAKETEPEELVFSFDDAVPEPPRGESTSAPITATEVPTGAEAPGEEIVFNFDDSIPEMPVPAELGPKIAEQKPASKGDSVYESIPLSDLDLGPLGESSDETLSVPSLAEEEPQNPLEAGLDLRIGPENTGVFDDDQTIPPEAALDKLPAGTVYLSQDFAQDPLGAKPAGWTGENPGYATLSVVGDPAGSANKCLEFRKTRGEGPTSFACAFPDVSGKVSIEFDMRCDEKNKHLLGFYIEKDGDFRRSVHTVVQSVDPNSPAHLRVFTKPTPYELKTWRHLRYVVDLADGLVDGYVDDQLVAEGVRMGTKTESLNTFSIRDNSESTGVLYLKNLVISQAEEDA